MVIGCGNGVIGGIWNGGGYVSLVRCNGVARW